jgi:tRNA U34 5-methylaminomethyl-2-thiouridine-forming methyltransferase MnmC
MKRVIKETADGSKTIFVEALDEHYHSVHGALAESRHVFIHSGLDAIESENVAILEIGFGTGLNAITTLERNQELKKNIEYTGLEAYPVLTSDFYQLDYKKLDLSTAILPYLEKIHEANWGNFQEITSNFQLKKVEQKFQDINTKADFDLIYFDAFAPTVQPELWTEAIFEKMYTALKPNGILVTYCAKGQVKRNMKAAGFVIERLPGPPGKREMTRATKLLSE